MTARVNTIEQRKIVIICDNKPVTARALELFQTKWKLSENGHLLWTAALGSAGMYPTFSWHVKVGERYTIRAHRLAYTLAKGPIPEGWTVDHTCFIKRCGLPEHLEAVTAIENYKRWNDTVIACKRGHLFTEETNYIHPTGKWRECKICRYEAVKRHREN